MTVELDSERPKIAQQIDLAKVLAARKRLYPSEWYEPHAIVARDPLSEADRGHSRKGLASGQLQFHQSRHKIRTMAPGNGWGGTTAMGCEIDAWMRHTNRWQRTPPWPIRAVWFCPEFRQFDLVRRNLVEFCIGTIPVFKTSGFGGPRYEWEEDGSVMYLASYDRSWTHLQGIELDLCAFDEQPPPELWREMGARSRGKLKTRYICKATQTKGWSWMAADLYEPWLEFHKDRGMDEERAMLEQLHPYTWVWPKGGIHDNPVADDEDLAWHESRIWPSKKERKVRLYGGFESFVGDGVFDDDAIDWYRAQLPVWDEQIGAGVTGFLAPLEI